MGNRTNMKSVTQTPCEQLKLELWRDIVSVSIYLQHVHSTRSDQTTRSLSIMSFARYDASPSDDDRVDISLHQDAADRIRSHLLRITGHTRCMGSPLGE